MTSFSVYPTDFDGYNTIPVLRDSIDEIKAIDNNRLRSAIINIEQELGLQPSGTYSTVATRLDEIGDTRALHLSHIADTDSAHAASAISVADTLDIFFEDDVEGVLEEIGSLVPAQPDFIGADSSKVPNSGIPNWFDGYLSKSVYNVSSSDSVLLRSQPSTAVGVRGIQIIDVSSNTTSGTGAKLKLSGGVGSEFISWQAPGESDGVTVAVSSMAAGDVLTLSSGGNTTKKIRIARTSVALPIAPKEDTFDVYSTNAVPGYYSLPSAGFKQTDNITRTSVSDTGVSRLQAMVSGTVFPADRGTLVLQRKLRGSVDFFPIAILNMKNAFVEGTRATGQSVYTPTLSSFDTVLLYDRIPVSEDHIPYGTDASGNTLYDDYENDFSRLQIATYSIPMSNTNIVGGTMTSPEGILEADADADVSAYRMLHYKSEDVAGDFGGEPASTDVYSILETSVPDFNELPLNYTRIVNFYPDSSATRPGIEHINLVPVRKDISDLYFPLASANLKFLSGIPYYTAERTTTLLTGPAEGDHDSITDNNKFELEIRSNNSVFDKTYVREDILTMDTNAFDFRSGTAAGKFGAQIDVDELLDDGYAKYSASNLPNHADQAFYFAKDINVIDTGIPSVDTRLVPTPDTFSTAAFVVARMHDPFGPGADFDAYGHELVTRILVNSYGDDRSTDTSEWFTDEAYRVTDTHEYLGPTDSYAPPAFDSSITLAATSLQLGGKFSTTEANTPGIIYPRDNYSVGNGIAPNDSSITRDYSASEGDRTYRRTFTLGYAINAGKIRVKSGGDFLIAFDDIRYKNVNTRDRFGKIEIKIPGYGPNSTGWMDLGRLFSTGQYEDGAGALSGAVTGSTGDFTIPFTFGSRNNSGTENKVAIRVTYFGIHEEERSVSRKKIITLMQLLA